MATVTGLTADRMFAIEAATVVGGIILDGDLWLIKHDGTRVDCGPLPQGEPGPPGSITSSPASGDLTGNYPSPTLADGVVTDAKVASVNKDGSATTPSMRTLGTSASQAAAGDHSHGDTGWVNLDPIAGDAPFGTRAVVFAQYRKFGPMVHVRLRKDQAGSVDRSGNTGGNFPNVKILGTASVPTVACPNGHAVQGSANIIDSPAGVELNPDGSVVWTGGFPRNYPAGSSMLADFVFFTSN